MFVDSNHLLQAHSFIDEMFEAVLCDTKLSDNIMRDANFKRHSQLQFNFGPSASSLEPESHTEKLVKNFGFNQGEQTFQGNSLKIMLKKNA